MTTEKMLQDMYYDTCNKIAILNTRMEAMEMIGEEGTAEYETLSQIEWKLCDARQKMRKAFKETNV